MVIYQKPRQVGNQENFIVGKKTLSPEKGSIPENQQVSLLKQRIISTYTSWTKERIVLERNPKRKRWNRIFLSSMDVNRKFHKREREESIYKTITLNFI